MTLRALLIGYSGLVLVVTALVIVIGRAHRRSRRAVSEAWLEETAYDKRGDRV